MENITRRKINELLYQVNGAAIEVHRRLGGGLLESIYHEAMKKELSYRGIQFQTQVPVPVYYRGEKIKV